jgi:hypothetical protein
MDIPKWLLNSTDNIVNEIQKWEFRHQIKIQSCGGQRRSKLTHLRAAKVFALSPSPASRVQSVPIVWVVGKPRDNVRWNCQSFYQSPRWFIHSQIIVGVIKLPSRPSPGAPSMSSSIPLTTTHQFSTADTRQTDAILVHCEAASIRPRGRWLAGRGSTDRGTSFFEVRLDSTTLHGRAVRDSTDQSQR